MLRLSKSYALANGSYNIRMGQSIIYRKISKMLKTTVFKGNPQVFRFQQ